MTNNKSNTILKKLLEEIELPEKAYETAENRYKDIGEWFHRPSSSCVTFDPHIFSQGSFRLGTANKPENDEEYDLDMGCNLRDGVSKESFTQKQLKILVGDELEAYRDARGIKKDIVEKSRCWRLEYADNMSFHMDIVPCIPAANSVRDILKERMMETTQLDESLAVDVSNLAVAITDNTDSRYQNLTDDWRISNPEGYARWFESRMRMATTLLNEREMAFKLSIDDLPYYRWKTPLQGAIQILKRHRDTMFKEEDESKPISVIITTLAARAYKGETDLVSALSNILASMPAQIQVQVPFVPNPVNPAEDFADKWYSEDHAHLKLKENFSRWLMQAKADFAALCSNENSQIILEAADRGFSVNFDRTSIEYALGLSAAIVSSTKQVDANDARPWYEE